MKFLAKTFHGLEDVLAKELDVLGAKAVLPIKRAVSFEGDKKLLYKSNLHLRTALRILVPIAEFTANTDQELYNEVKSINWPEYININQTFAIDSVVFSERFTHSQYVALKVKDAIVDQFKERLGKRPSVDPKFADNRINVHIAHNKVSISLDSSGDSLHKRGYRRKGHIAPLNEVLAAGMLMLAEWDSTIPLIDPMCGSGTFLMEAAMMAYNMPPGIKKKHYSFMNWKDYDQDLWKKVSEESKSNMITPEVNIQGGDIAMQSIDLSKMASLDFNLRKAIKLERISFNKHLPSSESGMLILNPPYGERITPKDLLDLYESIGNQLKKSYAGFDAWIFSSNKEAMKRIGLRPSRKYTLFNGALECKFQKFSMYAGSHKIKKN
ncbi:MAG TPA: hypothetical protein EYN89_10015 [Flavobacteriales bacterium]|nr:hypothetical protein [Flavobacteriales bacterium]